MIPAAQLGWMAGVLDLRGKVLFKKNKTRATRQIVLMVESKEESVIKELSRMTGTSPEMQKQPIGKRDWLRRNCLEHCPTEHTHVEAPEFPAIARWTITGLAMAVVLWNLTPFLRNPKNLTEAMQEAFTNGVLQGQGSGATVSAILWLERLGWDIPPEIKQKMEAPKEEEAHATGQH